MKSPPDRSAQGDAGATAEVVAVCLSPGGIPKLPVDSVETTVDGLVGDGHEHEKHCRPHRAVSIQDIELLEDLRAEGFQVSPGAAGENLTVRGVNVQRLAAGDRLHFLDGPVLELTEPRKPCFVLDQIHPTLKEAIVGRCGFLARVVENGRFFPGQSIIVERGPG